MTAATGRFLILATLLVSTSGAVAGFAAGMRRSVQGAVWARRFAYAYSALMIAAVAVMEFALLRHDFSVGYVAQVGSREVPTWVTIVSLWSSLEGSILFWGLILGLYIAGATFLTRNRYPEYMPWAIGVWLSCASFFSFLIAGPANPFTTVVNPPMDGPGPNALLQNHFLMVIHPPFLYLGYVGMTIPFGLASAALLTGRLGHEFLRPLRAALLLPWIFLTVAIMLGGWWAYEVLGWGGYWAWDPVENASLLPWLTATAALHSAVVLERRGVLKGWTATLIQVTFLLTILGTFMTRSGVFNSVHSFTQSSIGPTILVFLAVALLFSLLLLAARVDRLTSEGGIESAASREGAFLVNNLFFVLLTLTVLIGTVFPLIVEATRGAQMSVGRPYFDRMAVPIGCALLFLMGVGPALPWGRLRKEDVFRRLIAPCLGGLVTAVIGLALTVRNPWTLLTLFFGGYTGWVTLREIAAPIGSRMRLGRSAGRAFVESQIRSGRRRFGGYIVHLAVLIVFVAIAVSSSMRTSHEFELQRGGTATIGRYGLRFIGAREVHEPHRDSVIADFEITSGGKSLGLLHPKMNQYATMREAIGTPDVHSTWREDLYLSVMNIDPQQQSVGIHAIVTPMVGWIWIAVMFMAGGGVLALLPSAGREQRILSAEAMAGLPPIPGAPEAIGES
jgi:cytochrome c-type biogenesis protein CcmF